MLFVPESREGVVLMAAMLIGSVIASLLLIFTIAVYLSSRRFVEVRIGKTKGAVWAIVKRIPSFIVAAGVLCLGIHVLINSTGFESQGLAGFGLLFYFHTVCVATVMLEIDEQPSWESLWV